MHYFNNGILLPSDQYVQAGKGFLLLGSTKDQQSEVVPARTITRSEFPVWPICHWGLLTWFAVWCCCAHVFSVKRV